MTDAFWIAAGFSAMMIGLAMPLYYTKKSFDGEPLEHIAFAIVVGAPVFLWGFGKAIYTIIGA